jgi:predicted GTPase
MAIYRVLVFGTTGVGKTSLCNELTGQNKEVSSSAQGTTFETYTYEPFSIHGHTFYITDTVGLNGSELDELSAKKSAEQLANLLEQSPEGFNVLIHVNGRKRDSLHDKNYEFFVKDLTKNKIPTLLVATGCENEQPMSAWAERNEAFLKQGCSYKEVIATCFVKGGIPDLERIYEPLRIESTEQLFSAILRNALLQPQHIDISVNSLTELWTAFVELIGAPKFLRATIKGGAYILITRLISEEVAKRATEKDGVVDKAIDSVVNVAKIGFNKVTSKILTNVRAIF